MCNAYSLTLCAFLFATKPSPFYGVVFILSGDETMNDQEFLHAFEQGHVHPFAHRDHIRMAWLYLRAHDEATALHHIRYGITHLAAKLGATGKYHETLTVFWAKAVRATMTTEIVEFEEFEAQNQQLFSAGYVKQFYSDALLWSEKARREWVEPDLQKLLVNE
jgi:hypothetical protein